MEWIKCSDRLPEEPCECSIYSHKLDLVSTAGFDGKTFYSPTMTFVVTRMVIRLRFAEYTALQCGSHFHRLRLTWWVSGGRILTARLGNNMNLKQSGPRQKILSSQMENVLGLSVFMGCIREI